MAAGVKVLRCNQRSGFGRLTSPAPDRPLRISERNVVTGLGGKFSGITLRSRKAVHVGNGWNRRKNVSCGYGGGGSDTECCSVEPPVVTLYELLEISQEVGLSEIKTAYRQMARRYHPDVCPPSAREECIRKFLQVQEAYEILVDPDLRADYDYRLKNPLSVQALTSGFAHDRRSGEQGWRCGANRDGVARKEAWRSQWEAQLGELRKSGRRKPGSWAERMRQKREEQGEGVA